MKKKDLLIVALIILVGAVYISFLFNDSVWQDEAFTMNILRKDFGQIVSATADDVHPPLYYFIAKIFTNCFGYSVPVVKFVSIVPVILIMLLVWFKAKKLFPEKYVTIGTLFSLLIAFIPVAYVQNIELRMYTWAMFFVTSSAVYAYEIYLNPKSKKNIILFILMGLCAAYTHYYAALTEVFVYLFLIGCLILKHKAYKQCLAIVIATIVGYLPWLPIFISQFVIVRDYWWLNVFNGESILGIIKYPFNGMFLNAFLIIFSTIIISMVAYTIKNKKDKENWFAIFCILAVILMVTTGCIVSLVLRPVFVNRYIYTGIGLLFLGISIGISKIEYGKLLRNIIIGIIVINLPFSYYSNYMREYETGTEEFKTFAENNIKADIFITTESNDIAHTLPYYLPDNEVKWARITKDTRGYVFSDSTLEDMKQLIPDATIEELFAGSIDGTMRFTIYYIK